MTIRTYDAIIGGAGLIGVSLALALQQRGMRVLVVDRSEPGREASYAGAGMLAAHEIESQTPLLTLAQASAAIYPDWVAKLQLDAETKVDFRRDGAITFAACVETPLDANQVASLEPRIEYAGEHAGFVQEDYVDPRTLIAAALEVARKRKIEIIHGSSITSIETRGQRVIGVRTERSTYAAPVVVNCCGAWAGQLGEDGTPTRPVKGHLVSLLPKNKETLKHVIRSHALDLYLIPRESGLIIAGSTVEEAGFDKSVDPDTVLRLHQKAANIVPELGEAKIHESWTGLRPGTPDALPILGGTHIEGYFAATGHFRNGILLAPITAVAMAQLIAQEKPGIDLSPFSPLRFVRHEVT